MTFLTAEWRNLLMANYAVDPAALRPYLPSYTELDTFDGVHYASLVGFLFDKTRVAGLSVPGYRRFEEVNLRFYVRYRKAGGWKRGVVFLREIVPRRLICAIANTLYGENYIRFPMRHEWKQDAEGLSVAYEWNVDGKWNHLRALVDPIAQPAAEGSAEEFITEHYWGYTQISGRCTGTYQVAHPRWDVHAVRSYAIDCDVERIYGAAFREALQDAPRSVFLAAGSAVQVMRGSRIYNTLTP